MGPRGLFKNVKFVFQLISFLKEVRLEAKKVNWPTRREVLRHTIIVIIFAFVVAVYLGTLDIVFQWFLGRL